MDGPRGGPAGERPHGGEDDGVRDRPSAGTQRGTPVRRVIAVDWSGAATGAARRIWRAVVEDGRLVALANGLDRDAVTAWLVGDVVRGGAGAHAVGHRPVRTIVGLDFAFGLPAWYARERGWTSAPAAWAALDERALRAILEGRCLPFWGRGATPTKPVVLREAPTRALRRTERTLDGGTPFSVFQLVGAGAVGLGSLRGAATLRALREAGARVWPMDDDDGGAGVVVCEIWPRLFIGRATKGDAGVRARIAREALEDAAIADGTHGEALTHATGSDDAFDALVAACGLWRRRAALVRLPDARDADERLEGRILAP